MYAYLFLLRFVLYIYIILRFGRDKVMAEGVFRKGITLMMFIVFVLSSTVTYSGDRSINVRVKNEQGREENVKLYGASYALIIGVSDYTAGWPKLPGVKTDVREVRAALEKQGFVVVPVENPDSEGLKKAFESFINKYGLSPDNRLLFYFAGHGHTIRPRMARRWAIHSAC
jgi:hypothetical protein